MKSYIAIVTCQATKKSKFLGDYGIRREKQNDARHFTDLADAERAAHYWCVEVREETGAEWDYQAIAV